MPTHSRSTVTRTAAVHLLDVALNHCREHRGEPPIAFHLNHWAEEAHGDMTPADHRLMIEAATLIVDYEASASAPGDAAHHNH